MKGSGIKRRNYFVDPGLQLRYMAAIILCMLLASFLTGVLMYFGIWGRAVSELSAWNLSEKMETASRLKDYENFRLGIADGRTSDRYFEEARLLSANEQQAVHYILDNTKNELVAMILPVVLVIAAASIFLSNKIAGPVIRIEKSVNAMTNGNLASSFRLRKGDELKGLSGMLDNMAGIFRRKIEVAVNSLDEIIKDAEKLSPAQVKAKAEEARKHLLYFKTKP
jgi:methyl-accepting chemotaxis protein